MTTCGVTLKFADGLLLQNTTLGWLRDRGAGGSAIADLFRRASTITIRNDPLAE